MKNRTTLMSTIVCLLPLVLAAILYPQLPEQIGVHFNSAGEVDNYMPKNIVAFGAPILMALLNLFTHFRVNQDPQIEYAGVSLKKISKWLIPVISLVFIPITLFISIGKSIPIVLIGQALAGLVVVMIGNYLPKCKRNYTIGIKLPWTLNSEENWNKTQRFTGFVWTIGGFVIILNAFLNLWVYLIIVEIALLIVLPFIYSYVYYRKEQGNGHWDGNS